MEEIVRQVMAAVEKSGLVEIEVSARHVHLTQSDFEILFGKGTTMTPKRDLSQPGQFASNEKVTIVGPKKEMTASILGPVRSASQVEISLTDARTLGIAAPVRESGDIAGSGVYRVVDIICYINSAGIGGISRCKDILRNGVVMPVITKLGNRICRKNYSAVRAVAGRAFVPRHIHVAECACGYIR